MGCTGVNFTPGRSTSRVTRSARSAPTIYRVHAPFSTPQPSIRSHPARARYTHRARSSDIDARGGGGPPRGNPRPPTTFGEGPSHGEGPQSILWVGCGLGFGAACAQAWTAYRQWWQRNASELFTDGLDKWVWVIVCTD